VSLWDEIAPRRLPGEAIARAAAQPEVARALSWLVERLDESVAATVALAQIPAPMSAERRRAEWVAERLRALGAADVAIFGSGNAIGRFGPAEGAGIALLAHIDTVFPAELDHRVRCESGRLYGPSVGDNAAGVAGLLGACAALQAAGFRWTRPVWIVGDVGEEGLGDLRGARESIEHLAGRLGAVLAVEGTMLGRLGHVAVGSRRLRVVFRGPGGHSWLDFGRPSAVHAAVLAAAEILALDVPAEPRTTYNIGRIEGGQGVNVLAPTAEFLLDLRSVDAGVLADLVRRVEAIVRGPRVTAGGAIAVEIDEVGNRPAGSIPQTHPLVALCAAALRHVGVRPEPTAGSTDANIPLSRGIPALAIGVTRGGGTHSAGEWIETAPMLRGMQQIALLLAVLAGAR